MKIVPNSYRIGTQELILAKIGKKMIKIIK